MTASSARASSIRRAHGTTRPTPRWQTWALLLGVGLASRAEAADRDPIEELPVSLRLDPGGAPLDATQSAKLSSGAVVSRLLEAQPGQTREAVALVLIESSPARVFAVLRDYPHFAEFMPHVSSATVDDHTGNRYLVSYVIHGLLGMGNRNYQLEVFDEHEHVDGLDVLVSRFKYTGKGTINESRGTWQIVPVRGGAASFVRYAARIDPGGAIPSWMKTRGVASGVVDAVKAVRDRSVAK